MASVLPKPPIRVTAATIANLRWYICGLLYMWMAVTLISIAAATHQGRSANTFSLPSDVFPLGAVASVVGLGGMAGTVGGLLVSPAIGYWLDWSNGAYGPLFVAAGTLYLIALLIIHLLVPNLQKAS